MANATTAGTNEHSLEFNKYQAVLKSGEVVAANRFASLDSNGELINPTGSATEVPAGLFLTDSNDRQSGDSSLRTGDGTIEWIVEGGKIVKKLTISGSTASDKRAQVWATDNQTLSTTSIDDVIPHGYIHEWHSADNVDVYIYTQAEITAMEYAASLNEVPGGVD